MGARRGTGWPARAVRMLAPGLRILTVTAVFTVVVTVELPAAAWGVEEGQLTEQRLVDARVRASQLRAEERRRSADLGTMTAALEVAAAQSALALETYRAVAEARRNAQNELGRREAALVDAEIQLADQRAAMARWAREAYVDGGSLGTSAGVYTLLAGGDTNDVATHQTWLMRTGRSRAALGVQLRDAVERRRQATAEAERAARVVEAVAAEAFAALAARDAVLEAQRSQLADLEVALAATRDAADDAERRAVDLSAARLSAGLLVAAGPGENRVTGPVGDCPGEDVSGYPNGRIPRSALCPLSGTSGEALRADAAYAFNRMTVAYAARFGRPLCVTDSYRSYEEQVRVRAARPGWAAVPGRSNHGWGTAVDLCGGVQRFESPEHDWMRLNAPLFGWFHPAWAQRAGPLPEPWHWEFSG